MRRLTSTAQRERSVKNKVPLAATDVDGHGSVNREPKLRSLVVIGAGNVGSFLLGHLSRLRSFGHLTIIDHDSYEQKNLWGQDVTPRDIGKAKAEVQARRVRRINPTLSVSALVEPVENVPLGRLRADVILACVDSRAARLVINQAAWRLGVPWIDAGVRNEGLLARVEVYVPGSEAPCLECGWSQNDYDALESAYPCLGESGSAPPTDAPSSLGGLAAALQAIECEKLLAGDLNAALIARQVVLSAQTQSHFITALQRNPHCRFDHRILGIERLQASPSELSMGQVLALAPVVRGVHGELGLSVDGKTFLTEVRCPRCGDTRPAFFRLSGRLHRSQAVCATCKLERRATGLDAVERLSALLPKSHLARPLSSFGFRAGDVFTLSTADAETHFELGGGR